jgi:4'-phosphopantetheinyl transferase
MPLENLHKREDYAWALWKIQEEETILKDLVYPFEIVPEHVTNITKRLEFLAARVLIRELMLKFQLEFKGLTKDEFGKPFLSGYDFQVSLSHSYPYVAAVIHRTKSVGIDIEQPKQKLLKVAPRVLHAEELLDAGTDLEKHCVYWSAKESLLKIHGRKDLTFAENLLIDPFSKEKEGQLIGRIIVNGIETTIPLRYYIEKDFVVVVNLEDYEKI